MRQKISTTIQYQLTNVSLFRNIFFDWQNFNENLIKGPEHMKKFLFGKWNEVKKTMSQKDNLLVKNINKEVSIDNFDIAFNKTDYGIIYFSLFSLIMLIMTPLANLLS